MCHVKLSLKNRRKKVNATDNIGSWSDKHSSLGYAKYGLIALRMNKVCAEYNIFLCSKLYIFFSIQPKLITLCGIGIMHFNVVVYSCTINSSSTVLMSKFVTWRKTVKDFWCTSRWRMSFHTDEYSVFPCALFEGDG